MRILKIFIICNLLVSAFYVTSAAMVNHNDISMGFKENTGHNVHSNSIMSLNSQVIQGIPNTIIENVVLNGENLTLINSPNSIIRNVTIANFTQTVLAQDYGITLQNSPGTIIENVHIYNLTSNYQISGISVVDSIDVTISNTVIDNLDSSNNDYAYGIFVDNSNGVNITNSNITSINQQTTKGDSVGIQIQNTDYGYITSTKVDNIRGKDSGSYAFSNTYGIQLYRSNYFYLHNNTVSHINGISSYVPYHGGIALDEVSHTVIDNTTLNSLTTSASQAYSFGDANGFYMVFISNITISNTIIDHMVSSGANWARSAAIYAEQGSGLDILNVTINDISSNVGDGSTAAGIYYALFTDTNIINVNITNINSQRYAYGINIGNSNHNIQSMNIENVTSSYSLQTYTYGIYSYASNSVISDISVKNLISTSSFQTALTIAVHISGGKNSTYTQIATSEVSSSHQLIGIKVKGENITLHQVGVINGTAPDLSGILIETAVNISLADIFIDNFAGTQSNIGISVIGSKSIQIQNVNLTSTVIKTGIELLNSNKTRFQDIKLNATKLFGSILELQDITFIGLIFNNSILPQFTFINIPDSIEVYKDKNFSINWTIDISTTVSYSVSKNNTLFSQGQWIQNFAYTDTAPLSKLNLTIKLNITDLVIFRQTINVTTIFDLTAPVIITNPASVLVFVDGNVTLTWEVFEVNPGNYSLIVEDNLYATGTYSSDGIIEIILDSTNPLPVGNQKNFTLIIDDYYGNRLTKTWYQSVYGDFHSPVITSSPGDLSFVEDDEISFDYYVSEALPSNYTILIDGAIYDVGNWSINDISFNLGQFKPGTYNFKITFTDKSGNSRYDTFTLTVNAVPPTFVSVPQDLTLIVGESADLGWILQDSNPDSYNISINGEAYTSGTWQSNVPISIGFSYSDVGYYVVLLQANDTKGNIVTNTVNIEYKLANTSSNTNTGTSTNTGSNTNTGSSNTQTDTNTGSNTPSPTDLKNPSKGGFLPLSGFAFVGIISIAYFRRKMKH